MKAWRLHQPGGPDAFVLEDIPRPRATESQVLIEVRAFGLNRSEWFTRIGESPTVTLPRVLGIECVGNVVSAPAGQFQPGQRVAAMLGGMGRQFDGSYAEYTCVPDASVFPLQSDLPWENLGALPELLQTCHGSLHIGLEVRAGETLLIRGGTSSVGLATLAMAKLAGLKVLSTTRNQSKVDLLRSAGLAGLKVLSTTRNQSKVDLLRSAGADQVMVDDGTLAPKLRKMYPAGVDRVLELIGTSTLPDSLRCARSGGVVCMTGILGGEWELASFRPMGHIPSGVRLTSYSGGPSDISRDQLQNYVSMVEADELMIRRGPIWSFDQLPSGHQAMDENRANGKMVVIR